MRCFILAVAALACAICVYAVPPQVKAFEADVTIESSLMPSLDSHCYWDYDQQKYRVDSEAWGMKNYDISDYNASMRYIINDAFGQISCKTCFLDDDMNPMTVPLTALPDGTDTVNGETCDVWRMKWPMLDWSFCTQQHEPYAVLRTVMEMANAAGQIKTTMTFSNINVYHPPAAVFNPNTTECEPPKCDGPVDVALLIDGSGSISASDFMLMKKFASLLVQNLTVSEDTANFAAIQFSKTVEVEFPLTSKLNVILGGLSDMHQLDSSTNMDAGLDNAFAVLKASTRKVDQVLIMFTDGIPDQGNDPVAHAKPIKDAGIEIYTIGVGSDVDPKILKDIASEDKNPLQPHYMQADSFSALLDILSNVASAACKADTCGNGN